MKYPIIILLLFYKIIVALPESIIIREAIEEDLSALFDFDRVISYEYFLPLYRTGYSHLSLGKNPEYYLELELEEDKKWFPECINGDAESLWVAYDRCNNAIVGLIIAHQQTDIKKSKMCSVMRVRSCIYNQRSVVTNAIEIDLLLVAQEYRGKGIGKALVKYALNAFPEAYQCDVYPLRFANEQTLNFYYALGFVNKGIPEGDKVNIYGIPYKDMYRHFTYTK